MWNTHVHQLAAHPEDNQWQIGWYEHIWTINLQNFQVSSFINILLCQQVVSCPFHPQKASEWFKANEVQRKICALRDIAHQLKASTRPPANIKGVGQQCRPSQADQKGVGIANIHLVEEDSNCAEPRACATCFAKAERSAPCGLIWARMSCHVEWKQSLRSSCHISALVLLETSQRKGTDLSWLLAKLTKAWNRSVVHGSSRSLWVFLTACKTSLISIPLSLLGCGVFEAESHRRYGMRPCSFTTWNFYSKAPETGWPWQGSLAFPSKLSGLPWPTGVSVVIHFAWEIRRGKSTRNYYISRAKNHGVL